MDDDDERFLKLYGELSSKFNQVSRYGSCIGVCAYVHLWVEFHKSSKDYSFQYDKLENYSILEEFLLFNDFSMYIFGGHHVYYRKDIKISIRVDDIELSILKDDGKVNYKCFIKIYDLIDYLKDYLDLQNKLAIRE